MPEDENEETEEHEDDDESGGDDGDEEFDKDRALATIKKQRENEKKLRKQVKDTADELNRIKTKDLPENEQTKAERDTLKGENEALTAKLQKSVLRSEALEVATTLGFRNPALAVRLLDSDEVEWDDDGEPTNVKELLQAVLREEPSLKGRRRTTVTDDDEEEDDGDADAGAGRNGKAPKGNESINKAIRRMAGR